MMRWIKNIIYLGGKELRSLSRDPILLVLIFYLFTVALYVVSQGVNIEVNNASIAVVDEDRSELSRTIRHAFLLPYFQKPILIDLDEVDPAMDSGAYAFILDIPENFQADVLARRTPSVQLNVDATAMTLAGNGAAYAQNIISREVSGFLNHAEPGSDLPLGVVIRVKYNPNLHSSWFLSINQLINNVTILIIILSGAAVIREREHGTIEHLLVMPLTPGEIMAAKIWANGLVVVAATIASLYLVVNGAMAVPIAGSVILFALGTALYTFAVAALGITLATIARTMPQFVLLAIPVIMIMILLSGSISPLESMPVFLQTVMQIFPSPHFVKFAQAVLYRDAGIMIIWPHLLAITGIGVIFLAFALVRFRATMSAPN